MQGQIIEDAGAEESDTPLQAKLAVLATKIGYAGMFVAVTTFVALMIVKGAGGEAAKTRDWATWTISAFIYAVTIISSWPSQRCGTTPQRVMLLCSHRLLPVSSFSAGPAPRRDRLACLLNAQDAGGPEPHPAPGRLRNHGLCY